MRGSRTALTHFIAASALIVPLAANSQTLTTLHVFTGSNDGAEPYSALIEVGGKLYGTTEAGGAAGQGTVFEITASGVERVAHSFGGADGSAPSAVLIKYGTHLIGTTVFGGDSVCAGKGCGTIFTITPQGAERVEYSFQGGADGQVVEGSLVDASGAIYGTTALGGGTGCGGNGCGTVFKFEPGDHRETILHSFAGGNDGQIPTSALIRLGDSLYGTTVSGGAPGFGTVFKVDLATGTETVLHAFAGPDGRAPLSSLTRVGHKLYGTTFAGGASGDGAIFEIDPVSGATTVLHSFNGSDGIKPVGALVEANGHLYGSTYDGGAVGFGTLFQLNRETGDLTTIHSFTGADDGAHPVAPLVNVNGVLFGTTNEGGSSNAGTVFRFVP